MSSRNSEPAVEALDKGVLLRLAGCDVMPLDQHLLAPAQDRPCRSVRRRCRRRTLVARRGFIRAAVDGLIDCRRGIDRAAIAPHFFIPAYLESSYPRNISDYERHGFRIIGE